MDSSVKIIDFCAYSTKTDDIFRQSAQAETSYETALSELMYAVQYVSSTNNMPFIFVCAMVETEFKGTNLHKLDIDQIQTAMDFLSSICIRAKGIG